MLYRKLLRKCEQRNMPLLGAFCSNVGTHQINITRHHFMNSIKLILEEKCIVNGIVFLEAVHIASDSQHACDQ